MQVASLGIFLRESLDEGLRFFTYIAISCERQRKKVLSCVSEVFIFLVLRFRCFKEGISRVAEMLGENRWTSWVNDCDIVYICFTMISGLEVWSEQSKVRLLPGIIIDPVVFEFRGGLDSSLLGDLTDGVDDLVVTSVDFISLLATEEVTSMVINACLAYTSDVRGD